MKSEFEIAGRRVGRGQPCYVIAEAGVNHNCDVDLGRRLIDGAVEGGADAIKWQSYTASKIATRVAPRYWFEAHDPQGTQWDTFDKLDKLSEADFRALLEHARARGITALSTPFDDEAVCFLGELGLPAVKIASADLTCTPLVERAARLGRPLILSTGTATLGEVEEALEVCRRAGNERVVLLHCTLKYPCPPEGINLRMMEHLMRAFPEVPVGLSDHSLGISVPQAAVALGACVIEKHFTLSRAGGGPDDSFSLEPHELAALCHGARTAWEALGTVDYSIKDSERGNVKFRRSLYFVKALKAGELITPDAVRSVRPGFGAAPKHLDVVLGKRVLADTAVNTPVVLEQLVA